MTEINNQKLLSTQASGFRLLASVRRLVIKIGSSIIIDEASAGERKEWLESVAEDCAGLIAEGKEVIIVTSGAVAMGCRSMNLNRAKLKLEQKQASAAIGQISLAVAYRSAFSKVNLPIAQVLLTPDDTENRRRYLNARSTMETLLEHGVIPVINENDTVATDELKFGDNDRLAARVAQMTGSDLLIILSDIDGLYNANPNTNPKARRLDLVEEITPEIEMMAGGTGSQHGSGGMRTKIMAARIAAACGCASIITLGKINNPLSALFCGAGHTMFKASSTAANARKAWISGSMNPSGSYTLDNGAVAALQSGKSLLPSGVSRVDGSFERGDTVRLLDANGAEIGVGISAYSAQDAIMIIGNKSSAIASILGYEGRDELVHRNDLALR